MGFNEVESSFATPWTPDKKGDRIEGHFLGQELVDGGMNEKPYLSYRLRKKDNSVWAVAGGMLGSKMDQVPTGALISVEFLGMIKLKTGFSARDYKVGVDDSVTLLDPNSPEAITERRLAKVRLEAANNGAVVAAAAATVEDNIPF